MFAWKYMFFQLLSTIKENLVAKIMQSAYLCVIFHVKLKQLPFLAALAWFLLRRKIHDGNQDGDYLLVTSQASSCAITHKIYLILLRRSKAFGFLLKVKWFRNTATYQKLQGGAPSTPLPLVLQWGCGGRGGTTLLVRPRVKGTSINYNKDLDNFVYF